MFPDENEFRAGLFEHIGIGQDEWSAYWQQLKAYRDQHVAHLDFNRRDVSHFPALDLALASSAFYYRRLIAALRALGEGRYPDDLTAYYDAFYAQALEIADRATTSTRDIAERVR